MPSWLKRQYDDIKGNLKYELLKWGIYKILAAIGAAGMLALIVAFWQRLKHIPLDLVFLGILFLLSTAMFLYFSMRLDSRPRRVSSEEGQKPAITMFVNPKDPNLKADIGEILFHAHKTGPLPMDEFYILLCVQMVNHGEQEVAIVAWALTLEVGDHPINCDEESIPANWRINRRQSWGPDLSEEITPILTTPTNPLRKGIPMRGWLNFKWGILGRGYAPHNAKFTLKATDALGTEHIAAVLDPRFLEETGEIRETLASPSPEA